MSAPKPDRVITVESPFPIEELPRVWMWIEQSPHALKNNIGPQTMEAFVDEWVERSQRAITWGVYRDGILGGWIAYEPISRITGNAHIVFKKGEGRQDTFFGHKTTIPALTQACQDVFSIGIERVGMIVFESNRAVQSLIKALGGEIEAIHFNPRAETGEIVMPHGGTEPEPMLQYGIYRESFGKPNQKGMTYREWIQKAVEKERANA